MEDKKELFVIEKDLLMSVLNNLAQGPYQHVAYAIQILSRLEPVAEKEKPGGLEKKDKDK